MTRDKQEINLRSILIAEFFAKKINERGVKR